MLLAPYYVYTVGEAGPRVTTGGEASESRLLGSFNSTAVFTYLVKRRAACRAAEHPAPSITRISRHVEPAHRDVAEDEPAALPSHNLA